MPNHIHLIAVPDSEDGLKRAIGEAHRRYTRRVNFREGWRGHLWQGRFASYPMDERYLLAAVRYVELNPIRANLVKEPGKYPWSSAGAHLSGRDDALVTVGPFLKLVDDWGKFLSDDLTMKQTEVLRLHERTGRPLGSEPFINHLETLTGRVLCKHKPGPKKSSEN